MTGDAPASPLPPDPQGRLGARLATGLVLVVGLTLSIAAWVIVRDAVEREARFKFESEIGALEANAVARIRSYSDLLFGVQGLFQAHPETSRADFDNYVYSLDLPVRYPGVAAISYAPRVPAEGKAALAKHLRSDPELRRRGYRDVVIRPEGERREHFVITYIEPLHSNKTALGFDLASDPRRLELIERARDTGMPVLSGPQVLEADPQRRGSGLVMRLALYRKNAFTPDVARRRQAFVGVANVTFLVSEVAQQILASDEARVLRLSILDAGFVDAGPRPAPLELYSNVALLPKRPGPDFEGSLFIDFGQRRWELRFSAPRTLFMRPNDRLLPWMALAAVLALGLALGGLIHSLAGSRQRAYRLASQMTDDLLQSQARLREEQRRTQELIEALPNPVFFKGTDGRYLGVNKAWERYFGVPRENFLGKTVFDLYPGDPETAKRLDADDQALWRSGGTRSYETTITTPDGRVRNTIYYKATFADSGGTTAGLISTIVDITERKQAELRLALEHAVARLLSEGEDPGEVVAKVIQVIGEALGCACGTYWSADRSEQVMVCDRTWSLAFPELEAYTAAVRQLRHPLNVPGGLVMRVWMSGEPVWVGDVSQDPGFRRAALAQKAGLRGAFAFPVRSGADMLGVMEFFSRTSRLPDEELMRSTVAIGSRLGLFIGRQKAEERIRRLANYDELTGASNRSNFSQSLAHALATARRGGRQLALLFLDLDRFKNINDTLGHGAGDTVLREVAGRLRSCLRESDTVGRVGGDEFVVLLETLQDAEHAAVVAQKLLEAVARPFTVEGHEFHLTASIGIATFPADSKDEQGLLSSADIAMYRAKEQGKNRYQFYSAQMNVHTVARLAMETRLRGALEREEFVLHYQPKIHLASGRILGMEALVRWYHPVDGLVPPGQFIPLAEETGLIVPIGEWVLKTACAQSAAWRQAGLPALRVAVNLSPRQFVHEQLLQDIERILRETGMDSGALELEITEGMVMQDPGRATKLLDKLKAVGLIVAIDDFGTGYSSLGYLKRFPIDSLKIDRSFVKDLPNDAEDAAITQAIIVMAHSLGLRVVAEGVETESQAEFLRAHGCDEAQGFLFGRPVPAEAFAELVLGSNARGSRSKSGPYG